jgi:surface protein
MGISDRKRSIDIPVSINLDLNQETKPNQFLVDNNFKSGDFVIRKKSGNILAGSKLNVEGQGIYNVKIMTPDLNKKFPKQTPVSEGNPPTPTPSVTPTSIPFCQNNVLINGQLKQNLNGWSQNTPKTWVWTSNYDGSANFIGLNIGQPNNQIFQTNLKINATYNISFNVYGGTSCYGDSSIVVAVGNSSFGFDTTFNSEYTINNVVCVGNTNFTILAFDDCPNGPYNTIHINNVCVIEVLPPPTPTITPTKTLTPTPTPTITPTKTLTPTPTPTLPIPFVSVWRTTTPNEVITLPYELSGTYSGLIDWGDSTTSSNTYSNRFHTYTSPDDYVIRIYGVISGFTFNNTGSKSNIIEILQWSNLNIGNSGNYFYGCSNLILTGVTDTLTLSPSTTNLSGMFGSCTQLTTINNLDSWNVSNVTNMSDMFGQTDFNQNINNWDVSNVVDMSSMFVITQFNQPLSGWNVSNVTNMSSMFGGSQFNQNIDNWVVSGVTNMRSMFNNTPFNQPLSGWNVSNVTTMKTMFEENGVFNQNIDNWVVSGVTDMMGMFNGATSFNQPLSGWDVSNVTDMSEIFRDAVSFNQNINNWNVSGITDMTGVFQSATLFNQPLSGWNVSNVTNMFQMFRNADSFNQNINNWDVSNVTTMNTMFADINNFNQPLSGWNVSNVTNMNSMFSGAILFDQNIGNWNISGVTVMNNFMLGKTNSNYSTTNLDAIYNGWSTKNPKTGVTVNFGSIKYTSASSAGKAILTGSTGSGGYGWTITDGGLV